ncbi:MAG: 2-dehydropantoate 2-reductase [Paracoccaceae bacterium]
MRIAIMGAGALGGYFGGRLAAAGFDVTFIARGAHLAAMKTTGLKIESPRGNLCLPQVNATDDPCEVGPVDHVLFLVKNYDVEPAAHAIAPMLGPETAVAAFQNGVSAAERLGAVIGAERVIGGVARIPADVRKPGVIRHSSAHHELVFGEFGAPASERCLHLRDALRASGVDAEVAPDIVTLLWEKFVMLSALSAVTALSRLDIGPIRNNPMSTALLRAAAEECAAVGRAVHPALDADIAERQCRFLDTMPGNVHASMLDDLERGKRLELNYLSGDIVRLGREHGIPTPVHYVAQSALQPYVDGPPGAG